MTETQTKTKTRRIQDQKTIRAILGKINRKLDDPAITKEEWLGLVKDAVSLTKALQAAQNARKAYSSGQPGITQAAGELF